MKHKEIVSKVQKYISLERASDLTGYRKEYIVNFCGDKEIKTKIVKGKMYVERSFLELVKEEAGRAVYRKDESPRMRDVVFLFLKNFFSIKKIKKTIPQILSSALVLLLMVSVLNLSLGPAPRAYAATYSWTQTDWDVSASPGTYVTHSSPTPTVTSFDSSSGVVTSSDGVTLATASASWTQTTDTDFDAGTNSQTEISGSGTSGSVQLSLNGGSYYSTGTYTSPVYDTLGNANFGTLVFSSSIPSNSTLTIKVRTGTSTDMAGANNWTSCSNITSGNDISSDPCVTDGNRYVQYRATFGASSDLSQTSALSSTTINFNRIDKAEDTHTDTDFSGGTDSSTSRTQTVGSVELEEIPEGAYADGSVTISSGTVNINTDTLASGRSCADGGDGVSYNVTSLSSNTATLSASPSSGCLSAGDSVLLINLQGTASNYGNVGNYEIFEVLSVSSNTVTFASNKTKYYGDGTDSDDTNIGTATTNQRVMLQRVPRYTDLTISGGVLTASDWNGSKGGVLAFLASGAVTVGSGGSINMTGKGFRGSVADATQGESYSKLGAVSTSANLGGGGAYYLNDPFCFIATGAGAGYGSVGQGISPTAGGSIYGIADLSKFYLGSAGGTAANFGDTGGDGGGIVYIGAGSINSSAGNIISNGTSPTLHTSPNGGGSGGSIYLTGNSVVLGTASHITASGGTGDGVSDDCGSVNGGNGGVGRIHVKSSNISGNTTPAADTAALIVAIEYESSGVYTSDIQNLGSNTGLTTIDWTENEAGSILTDTDLQIKVRTCDDASCLGETAIASCPAFSRSDKGITDIASASSCVNNTDQYIQYQVVLSTTDTSITPQLQDISFNYINYTTTTGTLLSSWYNTTDIANIVSKINWSENESLPVGTAVKFQLRTATSTDGPAPNTDTATNFLGDADADGGFFQSDVGSCVKTGADVVCNIVDTSTEFTNMTADQWMQYKITLESSNGATPIVTSAGLEYVVNETPDFQSEATAVQRTDGIVEVVYSVRDTDSTTGTNSPNELTPSFEYSLDGGSTWSNITTGMNATSTDNKAVDEVTYSTYTMTWDPQLQIGLNTSTTTAKIRVTVNDNEAANNTASSMTADFNLTTVAISNLTASQSVDSGTLGKVLVGYDYSIYEGCSSISSVSLKYWDGASWLDATSLSGDYGTGVSSSTAKQIIWDAKTDYDGTYNETMQIRLVSSCSSNSQTVTSSSFSLDTKDPATSSTYVTVTATTSPATLNFDVSDDNSIEMKIGLSSDYSDGAWEAYQNSSTITLETDPDIAYVQFRDALGNTVSASVETMETALNLQAYDVANYVTGSYYMFLAWKPATTNITNFRRYNIWSSTNGTDYSLLDRVNVRTTNYYVHSGIATSTTYYYKISTEDTYGTSSYYSSEVNELADGQGGGDNVPPTISNVSVGSITTQSAVVTWDTDEVSRSTVGYSTIPYQFSSEVGVSTMADSESGIGQHQIFLTGLTPDTTYYFQAMSSDLSGNSDTDDNNGPGYTFTTNPGAVISDVVVSHVDNNMVTIVWNTDILADTTVVYSLNSDLSVPSELQGSVVLTNAHSVDITGLDQATTYYFYVKSVDAEGNIALDNLSGDYYSFTTNNDTTPPTITTGPTSASISDTTAIIQWTTDEDANARVYFGPESGNDISDYATSTSLAVNYNRDHTVALINLATSTKYYYRVYSSDANGNSVVSDEADFTTLEDLSLESEVLARELAARQGAAVSRRQSDADATAPTFSNIEILNITDSSAKIRWKTDENANGFVEYGLTNSYGTTIGSLNMSSVHEVNLNYLLPEKTYFFKVAGNDSSGNVYRSPEKSFKTISFVDQLEKNNEGDDSLSKTMTAEELDELFVSTVRQAMGLALKISSQVSLGTLETTVSEQFTNLEYLSTRISAPLMSGEPKVVTTAKTATISWKTDKPAGSFVAIAQEKDFKGTNSDEMGYVQVIGGNSTSTTDHTVMIYDLEPETNYHYQVRSKASVGTIGYSPDFTFKTRSEELEISSYTVKKNSNESVVFQWVTNVEADGTVRYTPYRNNTLSIEETTTISDKRNSFIHEIELDNLEAGVFYDVELTSKGVDGSITSRKIPTFSTSEDDLPPLIYSVKTDSAISTGKESKIQSIITWLTNEPSTSQVYYQKGIIGMDKPLANMTKLDSTYTKKHVVVITSFDLGTVYSFRVESTDSGGNVSLSKVYTILTPRHRESVFQVIMSNVEDIFGWVGDIRGR